MAKPAWWNWGALGSGGNVVGKGWAPPGTPSVGAKPHLKHRDPHLRYGTQMHGDAPLIGPPAVGTKPHGKRRDPHLRYGNPLPGMHGDLNITHGAGGVVTITHQPHGEDAGDAAAPGAADSQSPNYGSGSIAVDTDPLVSEVDVAIGNVHGIGTPGSFDATLTGGGMSPDAMTPDLGYLGYNDLDDTMNDDYNAFQGYADDPYSPPLREPTRRMYLANFGFEHEFYSGFGPAAVVGCEMGCATDTDLRG